MTTKKSSGKKEESSSTEESKVPAWSRDLIAKIITISVFILTAFITVYLLAFTEDKNASIDFIGKSLLPLWGTWLGTVLAFYFSKANFEAASNVIKRMTPEDKIANLRVKDTMLPLNRIEYLDYEKEKLVSLKTILAYPRFEPFNRFAVFDQNKVVKSMITRGLFYEFLYSKNIGASQSAVDLKLEDLLKTEDKKIQNMLFQGFGFVSVEATVLDAKRVIDWITECQNVFITQAGSATEPVLGLLTNTRIFEMAKV